MAQHSRKLKERLGLVNANPSPEPQVELKIPEPDRGREMISEMATGFAAAQTLLSERNMYKEQANAKARELVYIKNALRLHQNDAAYWRAIAMHYLKMNGQLAQLVQQFRHLTESVEITVANVEAACAATPLPPPMPVDLQEDDYSPPLGAVVGMEAATAGLLEAANAQPLPPATGSALAHDNGGAPMPDRDELTRLASRLAPDGIADATTPKP